MIKRRTTQKTGLWTGIAAIALIVLLLLWLTLAEATGNTDVAATIIN